MNSNNSATAQHQQIQLRLWDANYDADGKPIHAVTCRKPSAVHAVTEAQQRGSLHLHLLLWAEVRAPSDPDHQKMLERFERGPQRAAVP